jgi:predicted NBD/HSP70 family sugar kinase
MNTTSSLLDVKPRIAAPLDPGFVPAALATRAYRAAVARAAKTAVVSVALVRENGLVTRSDLPIIDPGSPHDADTLRMAERHVKFLVWAFGGWKLLVSAPVPVVRMLQDAYGPHGRRKFDAGIMQKAYDKAFVVEERQPGELPAHQESAAPVGGHLEGCRIGFDLGASDYKLAAVIDGRTVFSTEIPWQPSTQKDPAYHYNHIRDGLKAAAAHLPRLDAIGGSSAGIIVNNKVKVASLFRSVPADRFQEEASVIFDNLQREFGVPLVVMNDGDVTALAGALSLRRQPMLGVAMGSSLAAGFLNRQGAITGWLNELAFAPVDFSMEAATDEWSGDRGVGALYFSQQAVNKLAPAAGFAFPPDLLLPERLKAVQQKADAGDPAAAKIFETIGVYLGYSVAHYADYYDLANLLILGRVTSGRGGEIVMEQARAVLQSEFPELSRQVSVFVPDEKSRRVGQAVAAASLPEIGDVKSSG